MKKTVGLIVSLLIALTLLTGCVNVNYEVKVNRDGSGDISYIYGYSKETLENLKTSAENMVSSMREQAEESSYNVEVYEDEEIAGFKANKHVNDLSKEMSMQKEFGEEWIKDAEGNGINVEKGLFTIKYSQKAEIDLSNLEDFADSIKITYKVKLPAKAKTNNATETKGKELKWDLKVGEVNNIEFYATGVNLLAVIITLVIIVLVVAGVFATVFILKKKKGTKK